MILYPAIDILDGQAVRLVKGEFDAKTVYKDSPLEAAKAWVDAGARFLHIVDLDGAKVGEPRNLDWLRQISDELHVPIQWGGGLRSPDAVKEALGQGAERVILGTAAINDLDFLDTVMGSHRNRTIVGIDTKGGMVATSGWQETTTLTAVEVITRLQNRGVSRFVYTDVDHDGMLDGPDIENVKKLAAAVRGRWIYSGGIGTLEHLRQLRALRLVNLSGVITGKALYEKRFSVSDGQAALQNGSR